MYLFSCSFALIQFSKYINVKLKAFSILIETLLNYVFIILFFSKIGLRNNETIL